MKGVPTEKELGKIQEYYDIEDMYDEDEENSILPCGSEGSIKYEIIKNPNENSLAAAVIVFYGDLRDYSDTNEILKYFRNITLGRMIRSGILEIEVESQEPLVYQYSSASRQWILLNSKSDEEIEEENYGTE